MCAFTLPTFPLNALLSLPSASPPPALPRLLLPLVARIWIKIEFSPVPSCFIGCLLKPPVLSLVLFTRTRGAPGEQSNLRECALRVYGRSVARGKARRRQGVGGGIENCKTKPAGVEDAT